MRAVRRSKTRCDIGEDVILPLVYWTASCRWPGASVTALPRHKPKQRPNVTRKAHESPYISFCVCGRRGAWALARHPAQSTCEIRAQPPGHTQKLASSTFESGEPVRNPGASLVVMSKSWQADLRERRAGSPAKAAEQAVQGRVQSIAPTEAAEKAVAWLKLTWRVHRIWASAGAGEGCDEDNVDPLSSIVKECWRREAGALSERPRARPYHLPPVAWSITYEATFSISSSSRRPPKAATAWHGQEVERVVVEQRWGDRWGYGRVGCTAPLDEPNLASRSSRS